MKPYLTRFAEGRGQAAPQTVIVYDEEQQVSVLAESRALAVRARASSLMTKKADRERGEDLKDRWV